MTQSRCPYALLKRFRFCLQVSTENTLRPWSADPTTTSLPCCASVQHRNVWILPTGRGVQWPGESCSREAGGVEKGARVTGLWNCFEKIVGWVSVRFSPGSVGGAQPTRPDPG